VPEQRRVHDSRRLEVAVDDPRRMESGEPIDELSREPLDLERRERPA